MSNVASLFLLSTNLGCSTLTSGCIEFLGPRLSGDIVETFWSIANATMNNDLMRTCVPVIADNFDAFTAGPKFYSSTDPEYLASMLKDDRLSNVSEDSKLRVIAAWFEDAHPDDSSDAFKELLGTVELGNISSRKLVDVCSSNCFANLPESFRIEVLDDYVIAYELPSGDTTPYFTTANFLPGQPDINVKFALELRRECVVVSVYGCILLIGGEDDDGDPSDKTDIMDVYSGDVASLPPMMHSRSVKVERLPNLPTARSECSAVYVPAFGDIVVGGWQSRIQREVNNVELLEQCGGVTSEKCSWRALTPMLEWRRSPGIAYFHDRVVVAGGNDGERITVESFSVPSSARDMGQWTKLAGPEQGFGGPISLAVFKKRLLLAGSLQVYSKFFLTQNLDITNEVDFSRLRLLLFKLNSGGIDVLELSSESEVDDSELDGFTWKPQFTITGLTCARLLQMRDTTMKVKKA
uniref:BACK domain-containing protein n=1 Tax=Mesocestoides corti TaxID=53468 RepID=A0A5K3G3T4_MESCO